MSGWMTLITLTLPILSPTQTYRENSWLGTPLPHNSMLVRLRSRRPVPVQHLPGGLCVHCAPCSCVCGLGWNPSPSLQNPPNSSVVTAAWALCTLFKLQIITFPEVFPAPWEHSAMNMYRTLLIPQKASGLPCHVNDCTGQQNFGKQ